LKKIAQLKKLYSLYRSYSAKRSRNIPAPIRLWIEPTNWCNLRCVMCLNKNLAKSERGFMDFNIFKKIIDEASLFAHDINLFHRGESLLHPEIFRMIKYAKEKGLYTRLNTNATLLNEERSHQILDSGLDFLSFSFDGYEKKIYEDIRIGANFDKTLNNILAFLSMKKELARSAPYTTFTIIEFSDYSSDEIKGKIKKNFMKRFNSLPLERFVVRKPHNWAGGYDVKKSTSNKGPIRCTFPWYSLTIFWDGSVLPCPQDFYGKLVLGNVKDSSLSEIWNGPEEVLLRENLSGQQYKNLVSCDRCDRPGRKKLLGMPIAELGRFLKDNVIGYNKIVRRVLR